MGNRRRLIRGVNDLATTMPDIAAQWDYGKNGDLRPENVKAGSSDRVWWKCERGHEWKTAVYHRKAGHGCPYCTAVEGLITVGTDDLATMRPDLMEEWDCEKNVYSPEHLGIYSSVKVWWRCQEGHNWETAVKNRAVNDHGCPYCSSQKLLKGFNDLETRMPELAADWDYEKNGDLKPSCVMPGSTRKVWWRCSRGHEWEAAVYSRKAGSGCPYCSGQKILKGFNDLASVAPALAADWDDEKTANLSRMR